MEIYGKMWTYGVTGWFKPWAFLFSGGSDSGTSQNWYLEYHPGTCKELGSPQIEAINFGHGWKGCLTTPGLGDVPRDHHGTINHWTESWEPILQLRCRWCNFFKASKVGWFSLRRKVAVPHLTFEIAFAWASKVPGFFQKVSKKIYQNFFSEKSAGWKTPP